jgi:hypothetical protein
MKITAIKVIENNEKRFYPAIFNPAIAFARDF